MDIKNIPYECPICFNQIAQTSNYIEFEVCNHQFHIACLNKWKKTRNNNSLIYSCILCAIPRNIKIVNIPDKKPLHYDKNVINNKTITVRSENNNKYPIKSKNINKNKHNNKHKHNKHKHNNKHKVIRNSESSIENNLVNETINPYNFDNLNTSENLHNYTLLNNINDISSPNYDSNKNKINNGSNNKYLNCCVIM